MKNEVKPDAFIEKRIARQKKKRKRRLKLYLSAFFLLAVSIYVILAFTVLFPIKNIKVSGSKIYSAEEIIKSCGIDYGDNLLSASESEAQKLLKSNLPYIEKVELDRDMPNTLKIIVRDAEEFSCYEIGGNYYTVSSSGWVLSKNVIMPKELFVVKAKGVECKVGKEIKYNDAEQKELVETIQKNLSSLKIQINMIDVTDVLNIKAKVEGRFDIEFGTQNDLYEKILHLNGMLKEIDEGKEGSIDLSMWTSDKPKANTKLNSVKK